MIILDINSVFIDVNKSNCHMSEYLSISKNDSLPYADVTVSMFRTIMYISRKNI
jgi:hypothetical protein